MRRPDQTKKRLLQEADEMAKGLHSTALIDIVTMRKFDTLCVCEIHALSAAKIKKVESTTATHDSLYSR